MDQSAAVLAVCVILVVAAMAKSGISIRFRIVQPDPFTADFASCCFALIAATAQFLAVEGVTLQHGVFLAAESAFECGFFLHSIYPHNKTQSVIAPGKNNRPYK